MGRERSSKATGRVRPLAEAVENRIRVWREILQMARAEGGDGTALEVAASFFRIDAEIEMRIRAGLLKAEDAVPGANGSNPIYTAVSLVDGEYIRAIALELQRRPDRVDRVIEIHLDCRRRILSVLQLGPERFIFGL